MKIAESELQIMWSIVYGLTWGIVPLVVWRAIYILIQKSRKPLWTTLIVTLVLGYLLQIQWLQIPLIRYHGLLMLCVPLGSFFLWKYLSGTTDHDRPRGSMSAALPPAS